MNYEHHYNAIMTRATERVLDGYSELHHIVPKCMGGTDNEDNLVYLTAKEHYVAHQLLLKMYPDTTSLAYAAMMVTVCNDRQERDNVLYNWVYVRVCLLANSRAIVTPHGVYRSVRFASVELNIARTTINSRLKSDTNKAWNYLNK